MEPEAGYTTADDTLPERLLNEPITTGPAKGEVSHLRRCCRSTTSCAAGTRRACPPKNAWRSSNWPVNW